MEQDRLAQLIDEVREQRLSRREALRLAGIGAGALALGPLLAACGSSKSVGPAASQAAIASLAPPSTAVSLDFWNPWSGPDGNFAKTMVQQFNGETKNVQVKVTTFPNPPYYEKIRTAKQSGNLPHIAVMHVDAIPQNAADAILTPMDDLVKLLNLSGGDFTEEIWKDIHYKNQAWAIPLDEHTESFYWNKSLFQTAGLDPEKPPTDKASFEQAAQAITSKTGVPGFMVVTSGPGGVFLSGTAWASVFYQGGGQWTNGDYSQATYNSQAGVQAAEWLRSLINDLKVSPKNVQSDSEIAAFAQGKNGMVWSGIWQTTRYQDALKDKLGAGPLPQIFGKGAWSGSHTLAVTARKSMSAQERQASYYFIDWFSQHSVEWAKAGQLPARKSVRDSAAFKALPAQSSIAKQIDDARFFPAIPAAGDMLFGPGGAGEAVLAVINGKKDAKAALDESAARYTKILQQNKQKYGF
ncbi:MAG: ABC transporter substrate-binding protein [Chloroflexota bacterium]|nr:ABC transporter substrate-binding protein [Chloroflexota bacterium]